MFEMIKAFVFDLDGVLYLGDNLVEGALETVAALRKEGRQVFFLTNNSSKGRQEIIQKLNKLGYGADEKITYCSSYAIASYLAEKSIKTVQVVGSVSLCDDLIVHGIEVVYYSDVSAVVVGHDLDISYNKIAKALDAIRNGAKLIVANVDPNYPAGDGRVLPGCGAMVGAIVGASDHQPDFIVGKPNTFMLKLLCKEHGLSAREICVVGDVIESDIQMADNFGCQSILFDPEDVHENFRGVKVKNLRDIITLIR